VSNLDAIQRMPGDDLERGRSCNYKQLIAAVHRAKAMNLNRQLPPHIVKRLSPVGIATFSFIMLHDHIDQQPVEHPHVRAHAFLPLKGVKIKSADDAYEHIMDIPLASWRRWSFKRPDGTLSEKGGLAHSRSIQAEITMGDLGKLMNGEGVTIENAVMREPDQS